MIGDRKDARGSKRSRKDRSSDDNERVRDKHSRKRYNGVHDRSIHGRSTSTSTIVCDEEPHLPSNVTFNITSTCGVDTGYDPECWAANQTSLVGVEADGSCTLQPTGPDSGVSVMNFGTVNGAAVDLVCSVVASSRLEDTNHNIEPSPGWGVTSGGAAPPVQVLWSSALPTQPVMLRQLAVTPICSIISDPVSTVRDAGVRSANLIAASVSSAEQVSDPSFDVGVLPSNLEEILSAGHPAAVPDFSVLQQYLLSRESSSPVKTVVSTSRVSKNTISLSEYRLRRQENASRGYNVYGGAVNSVQNTMPVVVDTSGDRPVSSVRESGSGCHAIAPGTSRASGSGAAVDRTAGPPETACGSVRDWVPLETVVARQTRYERFTRVMRTMPDGWSRVPTLRVGFR